MIYDLSINNEKQQAINKFKNLLDKGKKIDLKTKNNKKSISHNAYAHLLFSWFALEYGETMSYVKQEIFKKIVNPEIFKTDYVNVKTGEVREEWRSFAELDSLETSLSIDRFRDYSSREAGIYLPDPNDMVFINEIEKQVENNKQYI